MLLLSDIVVIVGIPTSDNEARPSPEEKTQESRPGGLWGVNGDYGCDDDNGDYGVHDGDDDDDDDDDDGDDNVVMKLSQRCYHVLVHIHIFIKYCEIIFRGGDDAVSNPEVEIVFWLNPKK